MNQKKFFVLLTSILLLVTPTIVLLGSHTTHADTVNPPILLTTLDYLDYEYILIEDTDWVNLTYINSEYTQASLTVEKIEFYDNHPMDNETKYRFTSNIIDPDHTFTPSLKTYTYQDINTGQLYTIIIDFTNIVPPISPLQQTYDILLLNYTNLQQNYGVFMHSYNNMTTLINNSLQLISDYNNAFNTLNSLIDTHTILTNDYNRLESDCNNLTILCVNISSDYNLTNTTLECIREQLRQNRSKLENISLNISYYKACLDDILHSKKTDAYLSPTKQYIRTNYDFNKEIDDLKHWNGLWPTICFVLVIITVLLMFGFYVIQKSKLKPSNVEMEESGYSPLADKHDNMIYNVMRKGKHIITDNRFLKKNKKETNETTTHSIETEYDPTKIDEQIEKKIQPIKEDMGTIKTDISSIHNNIDTLIATLTTPKKTSKAKKT
jgi:hypothetical protein